MSGRYGFKVIFLPSLNVMILEQDSRPHNYYQFGFLKISKSVTCKQRRMFCMLFVVKSLVYDPTTVLPNITWWLHHTNEIILHVHRWPKSVFDYGSIIILLKKMETFVWIRIPHPTKPAVHYTHWRYIVSFISLWYSIQHLLLTSFYLDKMATIS